MNVRGKGGLNTFIGIRYIFECVYLLCVLQIEALYVVLCERFYLHAISPIELL